MLSTKVHKARQLASHALPLTRRILSLGKGLLHKVTGLAGRLLGAVGRCVRQVTDHLLESKAVRLLLKLTMIVSAVATVLTGLAICCAANASAAEQVKSGRRCGVSRSIRKGESTMERKEFQAESKRLLELMIHSIYTHKETFLREILSNASDAIDKLCYRSLTDEQVGMKREDFAITIRPDQEARTLTVSDNGIGMNDTDLEQNLGVIASSGTFSSVRSWIRTPRATLSASSVWASTLPSWWPTTSPSSPGSTAMSRAGAGSPTAWRAIPSNPAGRTLWARISSCI